MSIVSILWRSIVFILLSTLNFEYLFNRQSNTLFSLLCLLIEVVLFYFLLLPLFKKLLK